MKGWQKKARIFIALLFIAPFSYGQKMLPDFTVEDKGGGRIVVSWSNPYESLVQLAVQRSYDSVKKFSSVFSAESPELPVNGFSDKIVQGLKVYYRIFYVMEGGAYFFTKSKRPLGIGEVDIVAYDSKRDLLNEDLLDAVKDETFEKEGEIYNGNKPIHIQLRDNASKSFTFPQFKVFRDSILTKTNDTLYQVSADTVWLQEYVPQYEQLTSNYVFTDRDGYIVIKLPDAGQKKYDLVFFEEDGTQVLELRNIKESKLTLDKTNFYHGGWYKFELTENGRVRERNKVFLPTDF